MELRERRETVSECKVGRDEVRVVVVGIMKGQRGVEQWGTQEETG